MEQLEVLDPKTPDQLDSFALLFYTLQFTALRITLHTLAAIYLIVRLYTLPIVFLYKVCAKRATPLFRLIGSTLASPIRTVRNTCRLYHVLSSQPQIMELAEIEKPSIDDAISVESILLKRLGIQEYHDTLQEVRRGDSQDSLTSVARAAIELAHEEPQNLPVAFRADVQPILSALVDNPQEENSCPECDHERSGCMTCTLATRNSSVDSNIPREAKSDAEFRPPPLMNDESLKLPWRQLQAKKSGKLQKKVLRY